MANDVSFNRFHHGCIIYNKKHIISTGSNKKRSNGILAKYGYYNCLLHAESDAILKADRNELKGASLLVIRIGKSKLCNSKPCSHCMALIKESGIKEVYYSGPDGELKHMII